MLCRGPERIYYYNAVYELIGRVCQIRNHFSRHVRIEMRSSAVMRNRSSILAGFIGQLDLFRQ